VLNRQKNTTSQIWLKNNRYSDFESVEAGWVVYPKLYGDAKPRLFARWTTDGYQTTGCFDVTCPGFVQVSKKILVGSIANPVSQKGVQDQRLLTIYILYDPPSKNWWLTYFGEKVGYWPGSLFKGGLQNNANSVEWGGDIYSQNVMKTPHTTTAMGSGEFADGFYTNACFIKNIGIVDSTKRMKLPKWVRSYSDEPDCYSVSNTDLKLNPPWFYFGGPGQNPKCA